MEHTSSSNSIKPNPPRHTKRRKTLHHAHNRGLTTQIRKSRPRIPQETRRARRSDDLALATAIILSLVPFIQKLKEGENTVHHGRAVEVVNGGEFSS